MRFPDHEYERRWREAQDGCRKHDVAGLVIWGRGGGQADGLADLSYMSNHYSPFPQVKDAPPHWSGRAHGVMILPAEGEPTLVVEVPDWRHDLVAVKDVRYALDLAKVAGEVVAEKGLVGERVGLVGGNQMSVAPYLRFVEHCDAEIVWVDNVIEDIRVRKTPEELDLLRAASKVGSEIIDAMMTTALTPGVTESQALASGYSIAAERCALVWDAATASGPNSDYYSYGTYPAWTDRRLEAGDFFHVDTYGFVNGYLYDLSRTAVVGGEPTEAQREVLEGAVTAIDTGIDAIRPGVEGRQAYAAVRDSLEEAGLAEPAGEGDQLRGPALSTSFPCHGHGLGKHGEYPWIVPWDENKIEAGMCIAVEVMAGRPDVGSVKLEQVVIVGEEENELLTQIPPYYENGG